MAKGKMFDVKKEVPSLALCRKLKELGYPQEGGGWYWVKTKTIGKETWRVGFQVKREDSYGRMHIDYQSEFSIPDIEVEEVVKAPTCRELGEWLPWYLPELKFLNAERNEDGFHYCYNEETFNGCYIIADTEPNARAKMLIWLVENGYLCFEKEDKENKEEIK